MLRGDFIWRGEEIIVEKNNFVNILIDGLNQVFKNGFKQNEVDRGILSKVFEPLPENYITASSAKRFENEFIGQDNELFSAGTYGYVYLIANENVTRVSLPNEKGSYAIISKLDPNFIIGAMPSAFAAFALGIPERTLIKNPIYSEDFYSDKKETDNLLSKFKMVAQVEFKDLSLKYPNLSIDKVYQNFIDEGIKLDNAQAYANAKTAGQSNFFHRTPSTSTSALDPNAYSQLKF